MLVLALAVRFVLELCLLATFAWAAYRLAPGVAGVALALVGVTVIGAVWGILLSPRRRIEIGALPRLLLELVLFALAAGALYAGGHVQLAGALIAAELIDKLALHFLQRALAPSSVAEAGGGD